MTNLDGKFVFYYQLDGIYRPNYKVEVKDEGFVFATITFTDSDPENVSTLDELITALADPLIDTINITANITGVTSSVVVGRTVTINGGGFYIRLHRTGSKRWVVLMIDYSFKLRQP